MLKLGGSTKYIIGYDLCHDYAQISYCQCGTDRVETLSSVVGEDSFRIPTALCKKQGVNQWFYGSDALKNEGEGGILIDNLLKLAVDGEIVLVDGQEFDPVALLTLFVKRSLGLLSSLGDSKIDSLVITCGDMTPRVLEVLERVVTGMKLKTEKVCYISYTESYYYYMLYQPPELWKFKSLLFDYHWGSREMRVYQMEGNKRTTPVAVFIEHENYRLEFAPMVGADEEIPGAQKERLDQQFFGLARQLGLNQMISSVYLIGEGFNGDWMQESLRYLCKGRRVFQGNNLYSKGACYYMLEQMQPSEAGQTNILLGQDNLKANIGMNIYRQGEESYLALLDAGTKWFEAKGSVEFYLQNGNEVELLITPLMERKGSIAKLPLRELPGEISRLKMDLYFKAENILVVQIEDLGFGAIRPATGKLWQEELRIF